MGEGKTLKDSGRPAEVEERRRIPRIQAWRKKKRRYFLMEKKKEESGSGDTPDKERR